jgi:hypothetical protein
MDWTASTSSHMALPPVMSTSSTIAMGARSSISPIPTATHGVVQQIKARGETPLLPK